ncbi:MAG: polyphosphate kinase 1 [Planctomycetota bacterium]
MTDMDADQPRYINRELGWLDFNARVLEQAKDERTRLLERAKFLAITGTNLDEFVMVRVGGLQLQLRNSRGLSRRDPTGRTVHEQLRAVLKRCHKHVDRQYRLLRNVIQPELDRHHIRRVDLGHCSDRLLAAAEQQFRGDVVAVLSPQALHDRQFPMLPGLGLHLCVQLKNADELSTASSQKGSNAPTQPIDDSSEESPDQFAVIPMGRTLPRVVPLPMETLGPGFADETNASNPKEESSENESLDSDLSRPSEVGFAYVLLEDLVSHFVDEFFPGREVVACSPFRITRNADIELREDGAGDLLGGMEEVLESRRLSDVVRLEVDAGANVELRQYLMDSFDIDREMIFDIDGPLDLGYLWTLHGLQGFDPLRDDDWPPQSSPAISPNETMFSAISHQDILLIHPYQRFDPVVRLIEEAAVDPDVLAIKQILYRTSRNSPIVTALKRAASRGKYVTVIVELKARFDEARNIEWAREMEQAGVQVIYGIRGLKTHAKVCIIVRRETQGLARYVHFGTGNYNEVTANLYGDVSLLTCDDELGTDATMFFNAVTGASHPQPLQQLGIAPLTLRRRLLSLIESEAERSRQGEKAEITAKLNALVDTEIIDALYAASQAGVKIRLNVRGICCLRPGIEGLSETIEVISIVDRFLEHARIIDFRHGGDHEIFISSADWMPRNLDRRVELLVPVNDRDCRRRLRETLQLYFQDNQNTWRMQPDGSYHRVAMAKREQPLRVQQVLYDRAVQAVGDPQRRASNPFEVAR